MGKILEETNTLTASEKLNSVRVYQLLYSAFIKYQQILTQIEQTSTPEAEQIFQVLLARDAVQDLLQSEKQAPASLLLKIAELDKRLQQKQGIIVAVQDYPH